MSDWRKAAIEAAKTYGLEEAERTFQEVADGLWEEDWPGTTIGDLAHVEAHIGPEPPRAEQVLRFCDELTEEDFAELAMLALDQSGAMSTTLQRVRHTLAHSEPDRFPRPRFAGDPCLFDWTEEVDRG